MLRRRLVTLIAGAFLFLRIGVSPTIARPHLERLHRAPNDCLVCAIAVYEELPATIWKRVLRVSYGTNMDHVYCIYRWHGTTYAYDTVHGSRTISPRRLDAEAVRLCVDRENLSGEYIR